MTNEQEDHLFKIQRKFYELVSLKYRKGQEEHQGNLWDMGYAEILDNAIDEAIDQVVYLLTLKESLDKCRITRKRRSRIKQ